MKNLKVSKKLILSFGIVLILFVFSVVVVAFSLGNIRADLAQFYNVPWQTRGAAQDLQANLAEQQKSLFRAVATTDESIIAPALADVELYEEKYKVIWICCLAKRLRQIGESWKILLIKSTLGTK